MYDSDFFLQSIVLASVKLFYCRNCNVYYYFNHQINDHSHPFVQIFCCNKCVESTYLFEL